MANQRIFYAIHQVGLKEDGDAGAFGATDVLHGVQSVGMSTNFNLEQVFELGQLAIYENIENIPDVQIDLTKVLDGYPLIWHQATKGATTTDPTLSGRSTSKAIFGMSIFEDTSEAAEGAASSTVQCSGMYVSSVSYSFSRDGNFTETCTLVGNDKVWLNTPTYGETLDPNLPTPTFSGQFSSTSDDSPIGSAGVNRREDLLFDSTGTTLDINGMVADVDCTILPPEVFGITASGTNEKTADVYGAHINSITCSVDLGRDQINELGRRGPYTRHVRFPTEVTCEIQVTSSSGDMVSATENGIFTTGVGCGADLGNLKNRTIRIATCEGTRIYLGAKNKLKSTNYSGGNSDGGNVDVSYSYSTFNDFTICHSGDPHASGSAFWSARSTWLVDPS
jgi:hypothetical protein